MVDMIQAMRDAQKAWAPAMREAIPRAVAPPKPEPSLDQMWQNMTARHIADLADQVGPEMTARFVKYMGRRNNG